MPKKFAKEKKEKEEKCGIRTWEGGASRERSLRTAARPISFAVGR
jgi:hypothetical protein